jgi:16S rRNA (adenine1518-N6/adenine1519-N6)-dimethyltransferase
VVRLRPRPAGRMADLGPLERVTAAAFGQRRKMLRSSLARAFDNPQKVLEELGLAPTARAEELSVADFERLALALDK